MIENQQTTEWLTIGEAMKYMKCSKATLYRYIKKYQIQVARLTGKTLISQQSINSVLLSLN